MHSRVDIGGISESDSEIGGGGTTNGAADDSRLVKSKLRLKHENPAKPE